MAFYDDFFHAAVDKDDAALSAAAQKIVDSPLEIKITESKAKNLSDLFDDRFIYNRDRLYLLPIIVKTLPFIKMSKKYFDEIMAGALDRALKTKDAELEALCVANIPSAFVSERITGFAFFLFLRAFLKGDEVEANKFLKEALGQHLGKYQLEEIELVKGREAEVESLIDGIRPVVLQEKILTTLKKQKNTEAYLLMQKAEIDWDIAGAKWKENANCFKSKLTLCFKVEDFSQLSDAIKDQISKTAETVNPRDYFAYEFEKIEFKKIK